MYKFQNIFIYFLVGLFITIFTQVTVFSESLSIPQLIFNSKNTAVVITDPQNDFLSPKGVTWGMVGKNVTENNTVENLETLMKTAKKNGYLLFISPHYYYPTDHGWQFEGTLEKAMHSINMFDRKGPLNLEDFEGSGADG